MDPVIETVFVDGVYQEERRKARRNATSFSRRSTDNNLIVFSVEPKIDERYFVPIENQLGQYIDITI